MIYESNKQSSHQKDGSFVLIHIIIFLCDIGTVVFDMTYKVG